MERDYAFNTKEDRASAIDVINTYDGRPIDDIEPHFKYITVEVGNYILRVFIDDSDNTVMSYAFEEGEDKKDNETLKKILKYTAIGLIGVIIGRKTSRYKRFKGSFKIQTEPNWSNEMCYAAENIMNQLNSRMKENNLVFVIDKKRKK